MSGEFFNLYLHQNFLNFFSEVEDVARASKYLSDADLLTAEWTVSILFLRHSKTNKRTNGWNTTYNTTGVGISFLEYVDNSLFYYEIIILENELQCIY